MPPHRPRVLLVQLPIPQLGIEPARGNVPLAAGYLHLYARRAGLEGRYEIEILPPLLANRLGDQALVEAILARDPWMVGFTCYLWNVERSLSIAAALRARHPQLRILVGGPEITPDNAWVLQSPDVDLAVFGEGEITFVEMLRALQSDAVPPESIPGLYVAPPVRHRRRRRRDGTTPALVLPPVRQPLPQLDLVGSPYLARILDAAAEPLYLLETVRGCVFKCKFCYYPKSYEGLHWLSLEQIRASLEHARLHGVEEVILLDPTLNQRRDFAGFLRLLAECNPEHAFTYFGELRAEGIDGEIAAQLRAANFTEVEIGLQTVDARAQTLMDRKNNLRAYEKGVRALLDAGLQVTVDLIVGLPGDTPASVRKSIATVQESGLYSDIQVFNLAVLPGTAFREEAAALGLEYQARPPYYVLRTPTLDLETIYGLMAEAESAFESEFDPLPPPHLDAGPMAGDPPGLARAWVVDFDGAAAPPPPPPAARAQAFTLWLRGRDLGSRRRDCARMVRELLADNPHTTLQIVLEPAGDPRTVTPTLLEALLHAAYASPTYLDRFDAVLPGPVKGSKRLVVVAPVGARERVGPGWIAAIGDAASLAWRGDAAPAADLEPYEYVVS